MRKNLRFTSEHWGLLVWDSFRAHLTDGVKDLLDRQNVDVAVIPGGLTPVLQPPDKCINKPFKAKVRAQYEAWMVNGPFTYTPSGKKRAPSKEIVLRWIDRAWREIPVDLITRSFKSCGINNALDGTGWFGLGRRGRRSGYSYLSIPRENLKNNVQISGNHTCISSSAYSTNWFFHIASAHDYCT